MPRYVALIRFTPQGLKNITKSPGRAEAFKKEARALRGNVHEVYWALGGVRWRAGF